MSGAGRPAVTASEQRDASRDLRHYALAWLALVVLAAGSYVLSDLHLGRWATPAAFAIAGVKGAIVLLVFMHLMRTKSSVRLGAFVGVLLFALLIGFATADVVSRDPAPLLPLLPPRADSPAPRGEP
jgi:caa(3)-type oxidase subunit IV